MFKNKSKIKNMSETFISKHSFKVQVTTVIAVAGFIIYWSIAGGRLVNRLENVEALAERNKMCSGQLQTDSINNQIQMARIETELANINKSLLEIKTEMYQLVSAQLRN